MDPSDAGLAELVTLRSVRAADPALYARCGLRQLHRGRDPRQHSAPRSAKHPWR